MARGPLPNPNARRRNAPTIPTTQLPAGGRKGPAPDPPATYALRDAGRAWWSWAWSLPQAAAWDAGVLYVVARRAQLEDELAALDFGDLLELDDLLAGADEDAIRRVEWALSTLKKSATGSIALMKEMRELDGKLGLTPKALADLRWTIVDDEKAGETDPPKPKPKRPAARKHLRAVDPSAATA